MAGACMLEAAKAAACLRKTLGGGAGDGGIRAQCWPGERSWGTAGRHSKGRPNEQSGVVQLNTPPNTSVVPYSHISTTHDVVGAPIHCLGQLQPAPRCSVPPTANLKPPTANLQAVDSSGTKLPPPQVLCAPGQSLADVCASAPGSQPPTPVRGAAAANTTPAAAAAGNPGAATPTTSLFSAAAAAAFGVLGATTPTTGRTLVQGSPMPPGAPTATGAGAPGCGLAIRAGMGPGAAPGTAQLLALGLPRAMSRSWSGRESMAAAGLGPGPGMGMGVGMGGAGGQQGGGQGAGGMALLPPSGTRPGQQRRRSVVEGVKGGGGGAGGLGLGVGGVDQEAQGQGQQGPAGVTAAGATAAAVAEAEALLPPSRVSEMGSAQVRCWGGGVLSCPRALRHSLLTHAVAFERQLGQRTRLVCSCLRAVCRSSVLTAITSYTLACGILGLGLSGTCLLHLKRLRQPARLQVKAGQLNALLRAGLGHKDYLPDMYVMNFKLTGNGSGYVGWCC